MAPRLGGSAIVGHILAYGEPRAPPGSACTTMERMFAVTRHEVPAEQENDFLTRSAEMVDALRACAGHVATRVARALDEPTEWVVVSEWENVGTYRRALSTYDVRIRAVPLLSTARDEPSAFEVLLDSETGSRSSDRAG